MTKKTEEHTSYSASQNPKYLAKSKRDSALINAVKDGDNSAFATLIELYESKVRALGFSFFRNHTDTDDFVQDVFIKVYASLSSFRGDSLFSTWLLRIAYNLAINSVKRRKEYLPLSDKIELFDKDLGPEERLLRKYTMDAIRETLKELPEKYEACLDMYFFYDMPYNEISDVLGLPVNTIKSHIFRAKKILHDKLSAEL